jgi:hypothetical protein
VGGTGVCGTGGKVGAAVEQALGESSGYDFAVEQESGRIVRVQVKSTIAREGDGYTCCLKDSRGPYRGNKFDFVAAYVIPEDLWYIIPARKVKGQWSMGLHPELAKSKYGAYLEAWHLLRGRKSGKFVGRMEACAEEERIVSR